MKYIRIIIMVLLLICLVSCRGENANVDNAAQESEIRELVAITDNTPQGAALPNVEEPFYKDDSYIYIFGNPISEYVIVEFSDRSTQNVKEALADGNITIGDLDTFGIHYFAEPKLIKDIIYHSDRGGENDALEPFYSDEKYIYSYPSVRSDVVIVYYKDGTEQTAKDALAEGRIKIADLDWFGIKYWKEPVEGAE